VITTASSRPPAVLESLRFAAIFGSLRLGLVLIIAAYAVGTRVKYSAMGAAATTR